MQKSKKSNDMQTWDEIILKIMSEKKKKRAL